VPTGEEPLAGATHARDAALTESIAPSLLAWAERNGRCDLPWQLDPTPYRVWVSEIMLQQTQVATVIPYYEGFIERFPDVAALAAAPLDEVLHAWTGLGYYARARNLHRAAHLVVERHDGCLPDAIDALQTLPGIGRSTAGAILALSRGARHPILDGNARRVLARLFAVEGDPVSGDTLSRLWTLAEACTPQDRVPEYTQAIMDLGAAVCRRSRPLCDECPLQDACLAYRTGRQRELPSPRRRAARPCQSAYALVIRDAHGALLLQRRPSVGVWGGLWSLPQFETEKESLLWLATHLPTAIIERHDVPSQRHVFTHYELELRLRVARHDATRREIAGCTWYDRHNPARVGLTRAVTEILDTLCQ